MTISCLVTQNKSLIYAVQVFFFIIYVLPAENGAFPFSELYYSVIIYPNLSIITIELSFTRNKANVLILDCAPASFFVGCHIKVSQQRDATSKWKRLMCLAPEKLLL